MKKINLSRRQLILSSLASAGLFGLGTFSKVAWAQQSPGGGDGLSCQPIVMTDDGPLYPPGEIPWLSDLTQLPGSSSRPAGQLLYLFGRIRDHRCRPLAGATVEIWQADDSGNYKHPRVARPNQLDPNFGYFGRVRTGEDGSYLFKTIVPRAYNLGDIRRAPHIHLKMGSLTNGVLTTEMYFEVDEDEQVRSIDPVFSRRRKETSHRLILPKESPEAYRDLKLDFEKVPFAASTTLHSASPDGVTTSRWEGPQAANRQDERTPTLH